MANLLASKENSSGDVDEKRKLELLRMLTDCSWTMVQRDSFKVVYINKESIRLLPGNRRVAASLHDFVSPQRLKNGTELDQYESVLEFVVTDCANGGVAVIQRRMMSAWFGAGEVVAYDSASAEPNTVALWPTDDESLERTVSEAMCRV